MLVDLQPVYDIRKHCCFKIKVKVEKQLAQEGGYFRTSQML